jgi:hypothetical protein
MRTYKGTGNFLWIFPLNGKQIKCFTKKRLDFIYFQTDEKEVQGMYKTYI